MKKGNTLVEVIVSLAIILMALTIVSQIIIMSTKALNKRKVKEEAERIAYAIENEAKYNNNFRDLGEELTFRYSKDILNILIQEPLTALERGDNIILKRINDITKEDSEDKTLIYKYSIKVKDDNGGVLAEREFIKSYWMEKK